MLGFFVFKMVSLFCGCGAYVFFMGWGAAVNCHILRSEQNEQKSNSIKEIHMKEMDHLMWIEDLIQDFTKKNIAYRMCSRLVPHKLPWRDVAARMSGHPNFLFSCRSQILFGMKGSIKVPWNRKTPPL